MNGDNKSPSQFEIYWANLDPTVGREIKKTRPCVIVSPDELNNNLGTVIAAPLTRTIHPWPFRLTTELDGQKASIACDHIRSISKERLVKRAGKLSSPDKTRLIKIFQELFA